MICRYELTGKLHAGSETATSIWRLELPRHPFLLWCCQFHDHTTVGEKSKKNRHLSIWVQNTSKYGKNDTHLYELVGSYIWPSWHVFQSTIRCSKSFGQSFLLCHGPVHGGVIRLAAKDVKSNLGSLFLDVLNEEGNFHSATYLRIINMDGILHIIIIQ